VSLLGIKNVIVAVNKMDLMDYSENTYAQIKEDYLAFAENLAIKNIQFIPMSALEGDNVVNLSANTPWYTGQTMMEMLNTIEVDKTVNHDDFRFPVQYVNRPHLNYRGFAGTIVSGDIAVGDTVTALPSGKTSTVKSIDTFDAELESAKAGAAVTLTLNDEIDISRGDMIVKSDNQPFLNNSFTAHLVWMDEAAMIPNKQYNIKFATQKVAGTVSNIDYLIDVNTLEQTQGVHLQLNEIAKVDLKLTQAVACDAYTRNRKTGAFIVIDRLTNATVGAGMIISPNQEDTGSSHAFSEFEVEMNALVRKHFPHWGAIDITKLK
jgi:sulfate adenylyltransferase subunit 1